VTKAIWWSVGAFAVCLGGVSVTWALGVTIAATIIGSIP